MLRGSSKSFGGLRRGGQKVWRQKFSIAQPPHQSIYEHSLIRFRSRWMEEGEKSSKYFCILEKRTCEKKTVNRLINENGEVTSNQSEVMKEIHSYFQRLYSSNHQVDSNDFDSFLRNLNIPKLSENHKQMLDQPVSKNKLYNTLLSMNHDKSPGFDGLPTEFYICFFGQIFVIYWWTHTMFLWIMV